MKTTSAQAALEAVLAQAGACRPVRDSVDARIVSEVRNRTGSVIDSQWEVGGWPVYRSARPPMDHDRDGLPDDWEKAHGLNPNDATDAAKDRDANTAFSQSVEPLPFHAMSTYPYGVAESYPTDDAHRDYQATWNTRVMGAIPVTAAETLSASSPAGRRRSPAPRAAAPARSGRSWPCGSRRRWAGGRRGPRSRARGRRGTW